MVDDKGSRIYTPTLKDLCIKVIVDLIDEVEMFGDISSSVKLGISKIISKIYTKSCPNFLAIRCGDSKKWH
jgi:hypothetical protein